MKKRAYFLTLDAFIAIGIVVVGIVIILSQYSFQPYQSQVSFYTNDIMNTMYSTQIYEINDQYFHYLKTYKEQGEIQDIYSTVFEQMAYFLAKDCNKCKTMAKNLTRELTKDVISPKFSYNISLSNSSDSFVLYNISRTSEFGKIKKLENSSLVLSSKRIVLTDFNDKLHVFIGEVVVWQ